MQTRLERAAFADLMCHPLESQLPSWTLQKIRAQSSNPLVLKELERIRDSYVPSQSPETLFGSMQTRVRNYAQRILNPTETSDEPTR